MNTRDEIVKMGMDMYNKGEVDALTNLLTAFTVATKDVPTVSSEDVVDLISHALAVAKNR